eukprot:TRINITY_DN40026_c0_g1_i5.p1 TRINITY_DN40026_c0_g1~~TRINITY_DN40026_c0_g1_i5.p1  ORF type:complete len:1400 (+),score=209.38 TRINITY_DN40026_c0_g1_i5:110-4309(+)
MFSLLCPCYKRFQYYTKRGHSGAVTCVCTGSTQCEDGLTNSADWLVVTGGKDGHAVVWQLDPDCDAFRLKCMLVPSGGEGNVEDRSPINAVACFVRCQSTPGSGQLPYSDAYVITASQRDGIHIWHFRCEEDATLGSRSLRPVKFVDALSTAGLPERWDADGSCLSECAECGREAEVLCLTLVPPRAPIIQEQSDFCFSFFAGTSEGRARLWDVHRCAPGEFAGLTEGKDQHLRVQQATYEIESREGSKNSPATSIPEEFSPAFSMASSLSSHSHKKLYRLKHMPAVLVGSVTYSTLADGRRCIITGDSVGVVRLWHYGEAPMLLRVFEHGSEHAVQCCGITPAAFDDQYLMVATVNAEAAAACHLWRLPDQFEECDPSITSLGSKKSRVTINCDETYYMEASSFAFYTERSPKANNIGNMMSATLSMSSGKPRSVGNTASVLSRSFTRSLDADSHCHKMKLNAVTAGSDGTAKMWTLLDTDGMLTMPMWRASGRKSARLSMHRATTSDSLTEKGNDDDDDRREKCKIITQFEHRSRVTSVVTCCQSSPVGLKRIRSSSSTGSSSSTVSAPGEDGETRIRLRQMIVTAGTDKVCTLWDPRRAEPLRMFTAVRVMEMYWPICQMMLTTAQLASFTFSRDFKWSREAADPTASFAMLSTGDSLYAYAEAFPIQVVDLDWAVARQQFELKRTLASTAFLIFFTVLCLADVVQGASSWLVRIESMPEFRKEVREGLTGYGRKRMGKRHRLFWLVRHSRRVACLVTWLASNVLLVPASKAATQVFACETIFPDLELISCGSARHHVLSGLVAVSLPLFLWLTVPYSVVDGDAQQVDRDNLFKPSSWPDACKRHWGLSFRGPVHTRPDNVFKNAVADNLTKIVMSVTCIILDGSPHMKGLAILTILIVNLINFLIFRQFRAGFMNLIAVACKISNIHIAISGMYSASLDDLTDHSAGDYMRYGLVIILCLSVPAIYVTYNKYEKSEVERIRGLCLDPDEAERRGEVLMSRLGSKLARTAQAQMAKKFAALKRRAKAESAEPETVGLKHAASTDSLQGSSMFSSSGFRRPRMSISLKLPRGRSGISAAPLDDEREDDGLDSVRKGFSAPSLTPFSVFRKTVQFADDHRRRCSLSSDESEQSGEDALLRRVAAEMSDDDAEEMKGIPREALPYVTLTTTSSGPEPRLRSATWDGAFAPTVRETPDRRAVDAEAGEATLPGTANAREERQPADADQPADAGDMGPAGEHVTRTWVSGPVAGLQPGTSQLDEGLEERCCETLTRPSEDGWVPPSPPPLKPSPPGSLQQPPALHVQQEDGREVACDSASMTASLNPRSAASPAGDTSASLLLTGLDKEDILSWSPHPTGISRSSSIMTACVKQLSDDESSQCLSDFPAITADLGEDVQDS